MLSSRTGSVSRQFHWMFYIGIYPLVFACYLLSVAIGIASNSYITSTRDVSGLNCDARGRVAPEGGAI